MSIHELYTESEVPWRATSLPIVLDVLTTDTLTEVSRSRAFALLPFHLTSPDLLEQFFGHDRCAAVMEKMLDHCMDDEVAAEDRLEMIDLFEKLSIDSSALSCFLFNERESQEKSIARCGAHLASDRNVDRLVRYLDERDIAHLPADAFYSEEEQEPLLLLRLAKLLSLIAAEGLLSHLWTAFPLSKQMLL